MKRSPIARTSTLVRTAIVRKPPPAVQVARVSKLPVRGDASPRGGRHKKVLSIFRSRAYLAIVRLLPCVCCGLIGITEAAHSNQLKFGKGRGLKASDASAMALCATMPGRTGCHATHDQGGKLSKAEWKAFENQNIVATVMALLQLGLLAGDVGAVATLIPPAGFFDFELKATFLVGMVERRELRV